LAGVGRLVVFAEHRDYVSVIPPDFRALCRVGEVLYVMVHPARAFYGVQYCSPSHLAAGATGRSFGRCLVT
jgi:hypothetical protein